MTEFTPQSAHQRARAVNVTNRVLGQLASTPEFKIHESEISNWMRGGATLRKEKREALRIVLEQIEDLVTSTVARIDLTDATNVRIALIKLATVRADDDAATVPWKSDAAESAPAPHTDVTGATQILSGSRLSGATSVE